MKKSEHLFYLIRSLNKSEKRSVKLHLNTYSSEGSNNYTKLFDIIHAMDQYDHQHLINQAVDKIGTRNISTIKNQLTDLILKTLRQRSSFSYEGKKINRNIDYIEILFDRGLYDQALELISKTRGPAKKIEHYIALDRLSMYEFNILYRINNSQLIRDYIDKTYPETQSARDQNALQAELELLTLKTKLIFTGNTLKKQEKEEHIRAIMEHPLISSDLNALTTRSQLDIVNILAHYAYYRQDLENTYKNGKRALDIVEKLKLKPRVWLLHSKDLLLALTLFHAFDEFEKEYIHFETFQKQLTTKNKTSHFLSELDIIRTAVLISNATNLGEYSKALSYEEKIRLLLEDQSEFLSMDIITEYHANLSLAYMGIGDFKNALTWNNALLNHQNIKKIRRNKIAAERMKNICIHYALENYELVEYLADSTSRFIKKYELKSAFNTAFLDFAKKALTQEPNSETKLAIRTLVQAIETNKLTYHNIREKALSFHIKNWLNPLKN